MRQRIRKKVERSGKRKPQVWILLLSSNSGTAWWCCAYSAFRIQANISISLPQEMYPFFQVQQVASTLQISAYSIFFLLRVGNPSLISRSPKYKNCKLHNVVFEVMHTFLHPCQLTAKSCICLRASYWQSYWACPRWRIFKVLNFPPPPPSTPSSHTSQRLRELRNFFLPHCRNPLKFEMQIQSLENLEKVSIIIHFPPNHGASVPLSNWLNPVCINRSV